MQPRVTAQSQVSVLRQRMHEASIRHGAEVRADVPKILVRSTDGSGEVFFCRTGPITVSATLGEGDQRPLPTTVVLENLVVASPGFYDLLNVRIIANGDIRLITDDETTIHRLPENEPTLGCSRSARTQEYSWADREESMTSCIFGDLDSLFVRRHARRDEDKTQERKAIRV